MTRTHLHLAPNRQAGASLLEMMGVVLLIALIGAGGAYALYKLGVLGNQSDDSKNLSLLIANTRAGKDISGYGTGDLIPGLITGGDVPKNMSIVGNVVSNAYTGPVTVTGNGLTFTINTSQIPQSDCVKEAMSVSKVATSTAINGGTAIDGPLTKAQATSGCSSSGSNSISFISN